MFATLSSAILIAANKSEFTQWENLLESGQKDRLCRDGQYFASLKNLYKKRHSNSDKYRTHILRWVPEESEGLIVDVQSDMPVRFHPAVNKWLDYFSYGRGRADMLKWLVRASSLQTQIEDELNRQGMPKDLFYLAMIESGLSYKARSRARAKGMWQFMLPTAKGFGLRVDSWTDERRSVVASTIAASRYLKKLYGRFGSWDLAMASYNAGPGKVRRAIRLAGTKDYYKLRRTRYLRRETKEYVPKYTAALLIGKNPARYGFSIERSARKKVATKKVRLKNTYKLVDLARYYGVSTSRFKEWNPHLLRSTTPPIRRGQKPFYVYIPQTKLIAGGKFPSPVSAVRVKRSLMHRVARGDTLSAISRRYGITQRKIRRLNPGLRARYLKPGKKLRIRI
jgi:membrane-bound lytic murein transglycosylase D